MASIKSSKVPDGPPPDAVVKFDDDNLPKAVESPAQIANRDIAAYKLENVLIQGDLSKLTPEERLGYYRAVCNSLGLNPLTKPFQYINFRDKGLQLYATRDCTDQLRKIHQISVIAMEREVIDGAVYQVAVFGEDNTGRKDTATGAVFVKGLNGEPLANAFMKAETKAKRRLTLSIVGLGWLDEIEVDTIPDAERVNVDLETGEVRPGEWSGAIQTSDKPGSDLRLRYSTETGPDGSQDPVPYFGFRLVVEGRPVQVMVSGEEATAFFDDDGNNMLSDGDMVKVTGEMKLVPWEKDGRKMPPYRQIAAVEISAA